MGKKLNAVRAANNRLVSIVTPTYNRRKFIPNLIRCIEAQTWPKADLEWIIVDDGTDAVGDLVQHLPYVKYFRLDKKMLLGEKRNYANDRARGAFLVYFDDDDYHMPDRIMHSVQTLQSNPDKIIAASSKMYIYYKNMDELYTTKEFFKQHGTAGTFCFRKALLGLTRFDPKASKAEEKYFLKDYKVPMVQLDYEKTIVINCHDQNTFDKTKLLKTSGLEDTTKTISDVAPEWFFE